MQMLNLTSQKYFIQIILSFFNLFVQKKKKQLEEI